MLQIHKKLRTFEWNGDWEACRQAADAGEFDSELANAVGKRMYVEYNFQLKSDSVEFKVGWSVSTSHTFDKMWTLDKRVKSLSEREAKILFLAASDVFHKLEFGGRDTAEKQADLRDRMSKLCEMSNEICLIVDKHHDWDWDEFESREAQVEVLEAAYQQLFVETVRIYGQ